MAQSFREAGNDMGIVVRLFFDATSLITPFFNKHLPMTSIIRHKVTPGFALIVVLSLMMLLAMISVGFLSLSTISLRGATQGSDIAQARANAKMALMMAIGDLQKNAGPDQRITSSAEILPASKPAAPNRVKWLGVWDNSSYNPLQPDRKTFLRWLVSDSPAAIADATAAAKVDDMILFNGVSQDSSVRAPRIDIIQMNTRGSYSYWVEDEGIKADLSWNENAVATEIQQQTRRLSTAPGPDYGYLNGPFVESKIRYPLSKETGNFLNQGMERAQSVSDMPLVMGDTNHHRPWVIGARHDITMGSLGVLVDVKKGGLRRDLSLAFEMDGEADVSASSQPYRFNQQEGEFVGGNDRLAAPKAALGMRGVKERFLYRDSKTSGSTFSSYISSNSSVVRGPNWWALRDYANLYKRLRIENGNASLSARSYYPNVSAKNADYTLGKATGVASGISWDSEMNLGSHGDNYIFRPARSNYAPVILGCVCLYSAISQNSKLALGIDPLFYLWNPFNCEIKAQRFAIVAEHGFPGNITFFVTSENGQRKQYGPSTPKNYLAAYATGSTQNRPLTYLVSNLTMAPGEVMVVSPSSSRSSSANTFQDEARPGTNTDNESGVILNKIPTTDPSNARMIRWQEVPLNPTDKVEFTYTSEYEARNQVGDIQYNTNWFWLRTYLPAANTKASDLMSGINLGEEVQAIDSNSMGATDVPEHYDPGKNVAAPPVGPYLANTLANTKNFFGVLTYLMKPAFHMGKHPNPVEVFSHFNPAPIGNTLNDMWRPCGLNQVFSMVNRAGGANTLLQESGINFPATKLNNGFWGASYAMGSTSVPMSEIPRSPLTSLVSFTHASLATRATEPFHAIGNSWSNLFVSPVAPYDYVRMYPWGSPTAADSSWLLNDALFDRYYLSGIAPKFTLTASGYSATGSISDTLNSFFSNDDSSADVNPLLRPYLPIGHSTASAREVLAASDGYRKLGAFSMIKGAFNVNSTSRTAWAALLRGNRNLAIRFANSNQKDYAAGTPYPMGSLPTSPGNGSAPFWSGFTRLSDAHIDALATEIVKQVKARGPFMSLSDFINHRIGTPKTTANYQGALQAAIENSNINASVRSGAAGTAPIYSGAMGAYLPDPGPIGNRRTTTGVPTDITQAHLLLPLAPRLSARSDTFRIRAYGDVRSKDGARVIAKAICEAVVQRFPEYLDPHTDASNNEPWDESSSGNPSLNQINQRFGRRFRVIQFQWLSPQEV